MTDAAELGRVTAVFEAKYDGFMSWFSRPDLGRRRAPYSTWRRSGCPSARAAAGARAIAQHGVRVTCLCSVARRLNTSPSRALEAMFDQAIASCWVPTTPRLSRVRARRLALNLTTFCAAHHQRGVHTGLIRISGHAPDALVFELPVGRSASGDRVL